MTPKKEILLIVDDIPENLDVLISFLEKCNFNIIVAKSGEETFERLEYVKPGIILLDIMMPGIDGYETCRRLKKDDRYNDIPVIFMSALDDTVDKVKGLEVGAVDYISKPFMHEEVLARINNHLQIKDLRNKLEIANRSLEKRVVERTVELEETNRKLREEITDRKMAEEKLRDSERGLKEAEHLAHLGHWSLDLINNKLYWSDEVYRIFGTDPEEFDTTYDGFMGFVHPEDRDLVNSAYNKSLQNKTPYEITHRILLKDKKTKYVYEKGISNYDDNGNAISSIGTIHDITVRKLHELELEKYRGRLECLVEERTKELEEANERLKEIDQLKSMFIASMSHELRTPLNSIIGFTGMTLMGLSGELNEEQTDNIQRAHRSSKHLLALISDIIDISKIEAGAVEAYCEPFSLHEITDDAINNIQHILKGKNISVEVNVPEGIDLNTDRKRLLQCLVNLLSNAAKYTDAGKIVVSSKVVRENIELSVADTGIGISRNDLPKLFKAFERLQTHLTVKEGGTGLGLYLTKKITTELLKGIIEVESREGVGSTFRLIVPMILNVKKSE
jgi:PAS domain S-box-containing protein